MEAKLCMLRRLLLDRAAKHLSERPPNRRAADRLQKAVLQLDVKNANPLTRVNAVPASIDLGLLVVPVSISGESDGEYEAFMQLVQQTVTDFNAGVYLITKEK